MATGDLIVENSLFPTFRAELNSNLQALGTNQFNATAPATTYPCQFWADDTADLFKIRNSGNTSWLTLGRLDQAWWGITPADIGGLTIASNLNDVANKTTAIQNLGIYQPNRNWITNGDFLIATRGVTGFVSGGIARSMDGWRFLTNGDGGTTATGSHTRQTFTPGTLPGEPRNFARITNTTTGTSLGALSSHVFDNVIEGVHTLAGQSATFSFYARSTISGKVLGLALAQFFGIGGSTTAFVTGTSFTLSTTWTRYSFTFTWPSIAGKTLGDGHALNPRFVLQCGATAASNLGLPAAIGWQGTGDTEIANVQLEEGAVMTPFNRKTSAETLTECQRQSYRCTARWQGTVTSGHAYRAEIFFPVPLWRTPTVTALAGASYSLFPSSPVFENISNTQVTVTVTANASGNGSFNIPIEADGGL